MIQRKKHHTPEIEIGSEVIVKHWNKRGIVTAIVDGLYQINNDKALYEAVELRLVDDTIKTYQIAKMSGRTKLLNAIYKIVAADFKRRPENQYCHVNLPGCTANASQIHHKCGRQNLWLIASKFFLPTCHNCHMTIQVHSDSAIENGFSMHRNGLINISFTEFEQELLDKYKIRYK